MWVKNHPVRGTEMKKNFLLALGMFLMLISTAQSAQITATTTWLSKYVGSAGVVFHDDPVQQTDITLSFDNGVYVNAWNSLPWNGKEGFGKENDITIAWAGKLGDSGFSLDAGISYFDCYQLFNRENDTINPFAKLSYDWELNPNHTLTSSVKLEVPFNVSGGNGTVVTAKINHSWKLLEKLYLNHGPAFIWDNGACTEHEGIVARYDLGVSYLVTESFSLTAGVNISTPISSGMNDRETEMVGLISLSYSF